MNLIVIMLFLFSLSFWIMGIGLLYNKKMQAKFLGQLKMKKKNEYLKANGKYNLIIGVITTSLAVCVYFMPEYKVYICVAYVIVIFALSGIQMSLTKKYS